MTPEMNVPLASPLHVPLSADDAVTVVTRQIGFNKIGGDGIGFGSFCARRYKYLCQNGADALGRNS